MIQIVCSGLVWLSYVLPPQVVATASVSREPITISELGDSGPEVIDADMWWEVQFILQNALTGTQISINRGARRAADNEICLFLASSFFGCLNCPQSSPAPFTFYLFIYFFLVGTEGWVGGRNEMPQHSTALLSIQLPHTPGMAISFQSAANGKVILIYPVSH